jgi:hypothetical protein
LAVIFPAPRAHAQGATQADMIAELVAPDSCQIVEGDTVKVPFGDCVDLHLTVTFPGFGTFDVSDDPEVHFFLSPLNTDPDGCLSQTGPNQFCVREDAPGSCIGRRLTVFASFAGACLTSTAIVPSGLDCARSLLLNLDMGFRLFPADCTLRTETITPQFLVPSLANATIKLLSVTSNAPNGMFSGIQPAFVIVKDTSTPDSRNIIVQLRACLNPGGRRRVYHLTFLVTRSDGVTGQCTIQVDVPNCCRPRGIVIPSAPDVGQR